MEEQPKPLWANFRVSLLTLLSAPLFVIGALSVLAGNAALAVNFWPVGSLPPAEIFFGCLSLVTSGIFWLASAISFSQRKWIRTIALVVAGVLITAFGSWLN